MLFAVTSAALALGCILITEADRRYDFTTDALAAQWKRAVPLHNFAVLPAQTPMFNFAKGA